LARTGQGPYELQIVVSRLAVIMAQALLWCVEDILQTVEKP
jgi:hypothetical protein